MPDRRLITFARRMRHAPTDAEKRIWSYLRAHRLGGHHFRRQHPVPPYIADFYCHEARLVVELDGGQHTDADAAEYDARRSRVMEGMGLRVVRFSDYDALKDSDAVAATVLREVERRLAELRGWPAGGPAPEPPPP